MENYNDYSEYEEESYEQEREEKQRAEQSRDILAAFMQTYIR